MPDLLFEKFADPKNLKQAFLYVQAEVKKTTLALDPFWVPGIKAIETLQDAFFVSLSKLLTDDKYKPDQAYFFRQHKENYSIRRIAMLTAVDRVVYQALLNKSILGGQLSKNLSKLSMYPSVSANKELFLDDYKDCYQAYWTIQEEAYFKQGGMVYRGEYDVSSFYDNIAHEVLFNALEREKIGSKRVNALLRNLLSAWHRHGKGIPQGPDASSLIANFYLSPIDEFFENDNLGCGYIRYMDDMSLLTQTDKQLIESVERLTEVLDELDLNLNSKTKSEFIENNDYFQDKSHFGIYQSEAGEDEYPFFEKAKANAPQIITDLLAGKKVERTELSKLKYFLKADDEYLFYEDILNLYPLLPSFAASLTKYIEPVSSQRTIHEQIIRLWNEKHLFRWQKLWLAKVILIQKMKKQGFSKTTFKNSKNWELRSMDILVETMSDTITLSSKNFSSLIQKAEHVFELSIYASLISKVERNVDVNQIVANLCTNASLEIQSIVLAQILDDQALSQYSQDGNLFYLPLQSAQDNKTTSLISDSISSILGFSAATHPRKRYVFQLILEGDEILMIGSILNGWSAHALPSKKSGYYRLLKTMLSLHESYAPNKYHVYDQEVIKNSHLSPQGTEEVETIDVVKDKRFLHPLCKQLIDQLLQDGYEKSSRKIQFKSAIDEECFSLYPMDFQTEIARLADQVINPVN